MSAAQGSLPKPEGNVHPLDERRRYGRAFLPWVRRRARRLQAVFHLDRAWAVLEATNDYAHFTGSRLAHQAAKRHRDRLFDRLDAQLSHAAARAVDGGAR